MNGITALLIAALFIGVATLIIAMIAKFLGRFNEETRRIADKMRRAQDSDEYIYWQSRLRRHYIRLLPFVSEKTAGRIYNRLFRKPKHSAEKEHSDGLFHILAPSILSVCLCAVCLCGMSWAWFTATGNTSVSKIQAATYTATVTATRTVKVDNATETETLTADQNGEITFTNAGQYSITIQIGGTATIGYCKVEFDNTGYYTESLASGSILTFTVNAAINQTLTVTPQWGTYSGTADIEKGGSIGTPSNSNALSLTADSLTENVEEAVEEKAVPDTTQTDSEMKKDTDNTESSPAPEDTTAEETDKSNVEKGETAAQESSTTTSTQPESAGIEPSPASEAATAENTTAAQTEPPTPAESESN